VVSFRAAAIPVGMFSTLCAIVRARQQATGDVWTRPACESLLSRHTDNAAESAPCASKKRKHILCTSGSTNQSDAAFSANFELESKSFPPISPSLAPPSPSTENASCTSCELPSIQLTAQPEEPAQRLVHFMVKRDALRRNKEAGNPWPWSDDPILNTYRFTNVKREHDRTTRWMRSHWTGPNASRPSGEIIFNCALFRYFGNVKFLEAIGWQTAWGPDLQRQIADLAKQWREERRSVFTNAYIIPMLGKNGAKADCVCQSILAPLWESKVCPLLLQCQSFGASPSSSAPRFTRAGRSRSHRRSDQELAVSVHRHVRPYYRPYDLLAWPACHRCVGEALRRLPGFGGSGFMAKEVLQVSTTRTCRLKSRPRRHLLGGDGTGCVGLFGYLGSKADRRAVFDRISCTQTF
jgi:hypothetical protein